MGIKLLGLQMILRCFPMAGGGPGQGRRPVRLIGCDGRVRVFDRPVAAAEVMRDHPRHLVCRSDAFYIGQKTAALTAGERLVPGHSYFLLPAPFFHSVLSFVTLASSLAKANANSGNKRALLKPFDVHKTASGTLQIKFSDEFLIEHGVMEEEEAEEAEDSRRGRVCSTAALEKEYRELARCRRWRPGLETVREEEGRRRRVVVGFKGLSGFRRRRKKGTH